ncbi:MAG: hypothetical protein ACK56F_31900, partial [bacterium]
CLNGLGVDREELEAAASEDNNGSTEEVAVINMSSAQQQQNTFSRESAPEGPPRLPTALPLTSDGKDEDSM